MVDYFKVKHFFDKYVLLFGLFFLFLFSPNLFYLGFNDDGASYVSHAFTLGLDFDLDYTNEPVDQFSKNNLMPRHAIGSGILAAPFVAIFSLIDRFISHPIILDHTNYLGSWSLFGFVFSVNFLFFLAIYLYLKSFKLLGLLNKKNYWLIILLIFSSTVPHYILRSYYFSHGFEFFAISLLLWTITTLYKNRINNNKKRIYYILFGISLSLNIFIRYSNINLLLLAPLVFLIMNYFITIDSEKDLPQNSFSTIKNIFLISGISILPNIIFFKLKYGSFLPIPSQVYNKNFGFEGSSIMDTIGIILSRLPYVFNIIFGSEMGLLYTNPVIPIGFFSLIIFIVMTNKNERVTYKTILLISLILFFYGFSFAIHLWWQGMASSYGYRYLLQLFPVAIICILITQKYFSIKKIIFLKNFNRIILTFCTISIVSLALFTSTEKLQLSKQINTFGVEKAYSGNGYMLNLPLEMVKPYTWVRLVGKSTFGYFIAPIVINMNLFNFNSPSINSEEQNEFRRNDISKLIDRPKQMNINNVLQLLILLFLWLIAGFLLKKYKRIIIYEKING